MHDPADSYRATSYTDRWGTFRSVFVSHRSPAGRTYGVGADYDLDAVNVKLHQSTTVAISIGIALGIAGIMLVLVVQIIARRLDRAYTGLNLLAQVAQATGHGVAIADRHGTLHWTNNSFARHTHRSSLQTILPDAPELISALMIRQGTTCESQYQHGHWLLADLRSVDDAWILVVHDLTERKKLETDLQLARLAAESATKAKNAFLANMSHEIRTPMNGVLGMTELLIKSGLSYEQDGYARTVQRSAEALLNLLNDILDLSKVEAGKMTIEAVPTDVIQLVRDVAELLRPRAVSGAVEVLVRIAPKTAPGVATDPLRLRQILSNLIGNALKFTERGHVLIDVSTVSVGPARRRWVMRIEDTGIDIPADRLALLFQPFTQADNTIARNFGGTGLGLSISRQLIELLGGTLQVTSTIDVGSTFIIEVELPDAELPQVKLPEMRALMGVRVLVVDDNPVNRRILLEQLSAAGMDCSAVESGGVALVELGIAAGTNRPFNLILTDYRMPAMSGEDLGRAIRKDDTFGHQGLVLYTSEPIEQQSAWVCEHDFDGYLVKPARAEHLFQILCTALMPATSDQTRKRPAVAQPTIRTRPARVLIANDNPVNRLVASKMLEWLGGDVRCVDDGAQALAAWEHGDCDAILMDYQMPVMDGPTATKQIRQREASSQHIPIIAMTANTDAEDLAACIDAGMDAHLPKPITIDGLAQVIARWVPDTLPVSQADPQAD